MQLMFADGFSVGVGISPPSHNLMPNIKYTFKNKSYLKINAGLIYIQGIEVGKKYNGGIIKLRHQVSFFRRRSVLADGKKNTPTFYRLYMGYEKNVFNFSKDIDIFTEAGIDYDYSNLEGTLDGIIASGFQIKKGNLITKVGINISIRNLFNLDGTIQYYYANPILTFQYKF